jgi:hypothetical protein
VYESLNISGARVETATSFGGIGNGVPIFGISVQELLIAFIITAIGSILTYMAVKTPLKYADKIRCPELQFLLIRHKRRSYSHQNIIFIAFLISDNIINKNISKHLIKYFHV